MVTIDEADEMLDEIAMTLPQEFYSELNGGIMLLPEAKPHPESRAAGLYILGEYHYNREMGRYIVIYFGSFKYVYGDLPRARFKAELKKTLLHEFTHHLESLAGERGLEIEDELRLEEYYDRFS